MYKYEYINICNRSYALAITSASLPLGSHGDPPGVTGILDFEHENNGSEPQKTVCEQVLTAFFMIVYEFDSFCCVLRLEKTFEWAHEIDPNDRTKKLGNPPGLGTSWGPSEDPWGPHGRA